MTETKANVKCVITDFGYHEFDMVKKFEDNNSREFSTILTVHLFTMNPNTDV